MMQGAQLSAMKQPRGVGVVGGGGGGGEEGCM